MNDIVKIRKALTKVNRKKGKIGHLLEKKWHLCLFAGMALYWLIAWAWFRRRKFSVDYSNHLEELL